MKYFWMLLAVIICVGITQPVRAQEKSCAALAVSSDGAWGASWEDPVCAMALFSSYERCKRSTSVPEGCSQSAQQFDGWIAGYECSHKAEKSSPYRALGTGPTKEGAMKSALEGAEYLKYALSECVLLVAIASDGNHGPLTDAIVSTDTLTKKEVGARSDPDKGKPWGAVAIGIDGYYAASWNYDSQSEVTEQVKKTCQKGTSIPQPCVVKAMRAAWLTGIHCRLFPGDSKNQWVVIASDDTDQQAIERGYRAASASGYRREQCSVKIVISTDGKHKK